VPIHESLAGGQRVAVLTGDLVGSTLHSSSNTEEHGNGSLAYLKGSLRFVAKDVLHGDLIDFDIYRGDSFQGVVGVLDALRAAMLLRMHVQVRSALGSPDASALDVRIAVGIGTIQTGSSKRASEFDGTAFRRSGPLLDEMQGSGARLRFCTCCDSATSELNTECGLLDALMSRWSTEQTEAVFMHLLGHTQTKIAETIEVSQPAIAQRLGRAGRTAIDGFLRRYEILAKDIISHDYNDTL
jgi:hypothetical protein